MSSVASFALHMLKPLHWMGGQALWILQPFLGSPDTGRGRGAGVRGLTSGGVAHLLERDEGLDELAAHLERLQRESTSERSSGDGV